jgi:hypothetical protein
VTTVDDSVKPMSIGAQETGGIRGAWARSFRHGRESGLRFRAWVLHCIQRIVAISHTRRDLDSLAHSMKHLAKQNIQLLQLTNNLAGRLAYYEQGPLQESREEYLNNLEVGVMVKAGLVSLLKGNGHAR